MQAAVIQQLDAVRIERRNQFPIDVGLSFLAKLVLDIAGAPKLTRKLTGISVSRHLTHAIGIKRSCKLFCNRHGRERRPGFAKTVQNGAIAFLVCEPRKAHRPDARVWNVSNAVCKELFEGILLDFAKSAGAGANKRIVLQLDGAGWHGPENLAVPDGVRLVFQPSHSPELQPAEHLWEFVDEPLVNTYFETIQDLEKLVGERCVALTSQREMIRASTLFHWWPKPCEGN